MAHKVVDVCVVGGGLVGGAFASALAKSNIAVKAAMKICVLEASKLKSQPTSNPNFSNRVVSLNPSAADFLKDIGVWDNIDKEKRYPYYNINVLDSVSNTPLSFSTESADFKSPIAYIVENEAMINGISQSLLNYKSSNPNFTVHDSTKVGSIALLQNSAKSGFLDNDWPVIELEDGSTIQSRLIVGSDGGNSIVRQFAEIESHGFDYSQTAIVATLKIAELDDNLSAWQRFLPTGPVAMLPLAPGYSSLVWSLPSRLSAQVSRLPSETFIHLLNTAFQNPLLDLQFMLSQIQQGKEKDVNFEAEMKWGQERAAGQTQRVGDASSEAVGWKGGKVPLVTGLPNDNRAGFPLRLRHAKEYIKNRIALIGYHA
ncbi:putative ubiquinone biosynthesis monooxygenase [Nowakowskiella sp. JEL0407]|nr:putative ubiquinone biosynthesis monooxygenase [Nowakowskiella sp. JEL0407]